MDIQRIAAFSDGGLGGNPAGVALCQCLPPEDVMRKTAAAVGYSETVFSAPAGDGWRTRYFSPEAEIPFCGHATIALGSALAAQHGAGTYQLDINAGRVSVEGFETPEGWGATLRSPPTRHEQVSTPSLLEALKAFGLRSADLDPAIPPSRIHAGADHLLLAVRNRELVAAMRYAFDEFKEVMRRNEWVTVAICYAETPILIHARHAFAYGGVYEDPATGAGAAALGGYLRDIGSSAEEVIMRQGEDMGVPCRLVVRPEPGKGEPVCVSGSTRSCG